MRGAIFFDVLGWCQKSQRASKSHSFDIVGKRNSPNTTASAPVCTPGQCFQCLCLAGVEKQMLHDCTTAHKTEKTIKRMLHPNSAAMSFLKCCTFCLPASICEQHCMHCARMKKSWRRCSDGRWPKLLHSGRKEDTHWWLSWESWSWKQAKRKRKDTLKQTNQEHLDIGWWTSLVLNTKMHGFCVPVHGNMTQEKLFSGTSCHFNTMLLSWWQWWSLELLLLFHMFVNPPSLPILSFSCATKAMGVQDGGSSNALECEKCFLKTCHFTKTCSFQQQWNQQLVSLCEKMKPQCIHRHNEQKVCNDV